jgi:hypothetical protein
MYTLVYSKFANAVELQTSLLYIFTNLKAVKASTLKEAAAEINGASQGPWRIS